MRTLQRGLLWKRCSENMQTVPVPIQCAIEQVSEKSKTPLNSIIKLTHVNQEVNHLFSNSFAVGCQDVYGDIQCVCRAGYTGDRCERSVCECIS